MPLARWLGRSYLRAAIIPLLLIELSFLLIYWVSANFTYQKNVEAVGQISKNYLTDIASRQAQTINATLDEVEGLARVFAMESAEALAQPHDPPAAEKARYGFGADGVFYTRRGGQGESASFYSGYVPVGPAQIDKVWRSAQLDHTMKHIKAASPLVQQIYLNSWDSYNRIYPYFDVLEIYAPRMNIPAYNFYYEADARHNPGRKVVWTDAYVDPAGGGWMVSAIAPVYSPKRLEAVVGMDVTVDTIVRQILGLNLPWNGYAMLIGRDGTILALPPAGERDLGLRELKNHHYQDAIRGDTFKPEQFSIAKRSDLKPLMKAIVGGRRDVTRITLSGREFLAAAAPVEGPGWHLVVMAPAAGIFAHANALRDQLQTVGMAMLAILLVFYAGFFLFLTYRARAMSRRVAEPLKTIEALMDRIGSGEYDQDAPRFGVAELDTVSDRLVAMGGRLGGAYRQIVAQEDQVRHALESEKRITRGQRRFIDILSHEFRTPLTVIDSCGQILRRRAARLTEETVLERSDMIRRAAARIGDVMRSALQLVQLEEGSVAPHLATVPLGSLVSDAITASAEAAPGIAIRSATDAADGMVEVDPGLIRTALAAVIENGCKYSGEGKSVTVETACDETRYLIRVSDEGSGIPADELPLVRERFFRGANSTAVPGAGIGLYLAATLIEAHGGTLDIESTVDVGTTVTISLPRAGGGAIKLPEAA